MSGEAVHARLDELLDELPSRLQPIRQPSHLEGYRMWRLQRDRERWRMTNISSHVLGYWPRGPYEAHCPVLALPLPTNWSLAKALKGVTHEVPALECGCGLYAYWYRYMAMGYSVWDSLIVGKVWAWGRTLPGTRGFRSRFMLPVELYWPRCSFPESRDDSLRFRDDVGMLNDLTIRRRPVLCGKRAVLAEFDKPNWLEPFPQTADEGYAEGAQWVNFKGDPLWYCFEHAADEKGEEHPEGFDYFSVPAEDIMRDLGRFYSCEVVEAPDA